MPKFTEQQIQYAGDMLRQRYNAKRKPNASQEEKFYTDLVIALQPPLEQWHMRAENAELAASSRVKMTTMILASMLTSCLYNLCDFDKEKVESGLEWIVPQFKEYALAMLSDMESFETIKPVDG